MNQYNPDTVSAPGETIIELLEMHNLSKERLAELLDIEDIDALLDGRLPIEYNTAVRLHIIFNVSVNFWQAREDDYRRWVNKK